MQRQAKIGSSGGVISPESVALNKTTLSLVVGANETLTATVLPANATNKNVTWSSADSTIATVNTTGKVVAVKAGTTKITVKTVDGNKSAECALTVTAL
ncbi:TPA: Ig domain-containing protein [Enterococcus faecium]|nr:Ig domain-containing protein [Enterococcus faecium]HAZ1088430.1 Ig domain-containing protein [Enterococcus faecium]